MSSIGIPPVTPEGTAWKICPIATEITVMNASAPDAPMNVSSRLVRAARIVAMKNVLSPSSETCGGVRARRGVRRRAVGTPARLRCTARRTPRAQR